MAQTAALLISTHYHMQQAVRVRSVAREYHAMGFPTERNGMMTNGRTENSRVAFESKNLLPSRNKGQEKEKTERQEQFQRAPKSKSFPSVRKNPKSCCKKDKDSSPFRKSVHFADSFGLPLTREISYHREQEIEITSTCELQTSEWKSKPEGFGLKHKRIDVTPAVTPEPPKRTQPEVLFMFAQPSSEADFFTRVDKNYVCLENMKREGPCLQGYVRVTNIAYHKRVQVRWTADAWHSHQDRECTYSHTFQDSNTDCFTFKLPISGEQLELALHYTVNGQCYWDNNSGKNYKITIKR